jgi:hypothetical protein
VKRKRGNEREETKMKIVLAMSVTIKVDNGIATPLQLKRG